MWRGCMVVALLVVLVGCDDDDPVGPDTGTLEFSVTTTGEDLDPDGYTLDLDGGAMTESIEVNGSATLEDMEAGDHTVELTDVAANCTVDGDNPRTVGVESGATETVEFSVACTAAGL